MSNYKLQKANTNGFLNKIFLTIPKSNRTIEQQDNDSLNTMDYYKEENSSRNNKLMDNKCISKAKTSQAIDINSAIKIDSPNSSYKEKNSFLNQKLGGLYEEIKFVRTSSFFENNKEKEKNVEKRFENMNQSNAYCIKCNSEIEFTNKFCPHCLKPFCKKCIKEVFNRNLNNNDDKSNFDQKLLKQQLCPNCRNPIKINDIAKFNSTLLLNNFDLYKSYEQPLNCEIKNYYKNSQKILEQKEFVNKEFNEQNHQYDLLLEKIENKKREIEIKKNLNMNLIQIIQKSIEAEYNYNLNKLNEIYLKIQKIQDSIQNKKNLINHQKNFNNAEMIILVEKFQKILNSVSKNYEKLEQKIILKSKPKGYKVYEAKPLGVNITETYYMKEKEIFANQHIGNAYIKIDRYVNNYTNFLNFSVSIRQNENNSQKNNLTKNNNLDNKSKYVIYMLINNKIIKLNKTNKDNNKNSLNYDCSLEENFVFNSKGHSNDINRNIKKGDFDAKIIITELFL